MDTDICIVGGGLVGLTTAIALGRQGRVVKLLEAVDFKQAEPTALDARSIALSYSTIQIFRALGVWQNLQVNAAPITNIHVSSAGHFGVTRLNATDLQLDAMGYVIEYHILLQTLQQQLEPLANVELITPARVESVQQTENCVELTYLLKGRKTDKLKSALLIVADGAGSLLREKLDIKAETKEYDQAAIITNLKINRPSNDCAYERFTEDGPLALLPLPNQRYALVWTNKPAQAEALMQQSEQEFIRHLYQKIGYRLGLIEKVGSRVRFDLKLTRAQQLVTGRAVLIGNAANSLHPVAGQGFNLALRDIGLLFDLLSGIDIYSDQLKVQLALYQQQRRKDQNQAVLYGDQLVRLFSNNLPVLNHFRAGSLAVLDICPLLKKEISWLGMGYGTGCSSLMRGEVTT